MGWQDILYSLGIENSSGTKLPARQVAKFTGPGAPSIADDPTTGTTVLTFPSGPGGGIWITVAPGTALAADLSKPNLACDTSAAQSTITLPTAAQLAAADGSEFTIKCTGNMLSPVVVNAGAGTTVELLNAPGTFGASTWLPIQGQSVAFKYDLATTTWKLRASSEGSGAPGTSAYNPTWFAKTDVYWDPQAGVDSDTGAVGHPVKTFAEIVRRYGNTIFTGNSGQSVKIRQLSAQTAGTDPVFLTMRGTAGGQLVLDSSGAWIAPGADFAAGALGGGYGSAGAVPTAGGTAMTMAAVPGYVVAGVLLQNTTRNSFAFVRSVAGAVATLSQPQTTASMTTTTAIAAGVAANDWVAGDNIHPVTTPLLNLKRVSAIGGDVTAGGQPCAAWVIGANLADSSGNGTSEYALLGDSANQVLSLCLVTSRLHASANQGRGNGLYLLGCMVQGAFLLSSGSCAVYGGSFEAGGTNINGGIFQVFNNCNLHLSLNATAGAGTIVINASGAFADGNISLADCGTLVLGGKLYGTFSILNQATSGVVNALGAGTWGANLLTTGVLKFGTGGAAITVGTPASVGGTFVLNGITQVNVAPAGGQHFPANALISLSLNTVGATPGVVAPYFSAAQIADQFSVKSGTALANDTFNWRASGGSVTISAAALDLYGSLYDEFSGARYCLQQ